MVDLAIVRTRLDTLAEELGLTRKQRAAAEALLADPNARVPKTMRRHPKVRRYMDEAIVQQRELPTKGPPLPTQNEIVARMATRARAELFAFFEWPDPPRELSVGEVLMPSGAHFNLKKAVEAGLGPCIGSMEIDKDGISRVEFADPVAADIALGRWIGLEKLPPPVEDDAMRESREAYRTLLATDPEAARQMERYSIQVDMIRVSLKGGA